MGFIYIIHGPNEKKYIGQTKNSVEKRYKIHCRHALKQTSRCTYLHRAMIKYGIENFKCEVVEENDDDLLDELEIFYIDFFNTLFPNGYNLQTGGSSPKMHKETRERISKFYKTNDLPMYINIRKYSNYIRYRVQNHPMGIDKTFHTLEEAKQHVEYLDTLTKPLQNTKFTDVKYIQKYGSGYCVDIPNCKKKYFLHKEKDNYQRALNYLNQQLQHNQTAGNP
jgi:group I intron endonuclease